MKKQILLITSFLFFSLLIPVTSFGQGFYNTNIDDAVIKNQQQEEQEGKKLLENLNSKSATCEKLTNSDFEKIGEYFMGQSIGDIVRHINMNEMMKGMMGEKGEEQAHIAMGKRFSNCNVSATFPEQNNSFFWPMMGMMGGWSQYGQPYNTNYYPMMGNFGNYPFGSGMGFFGGGFMIIIWIIIIMGIIMLFRGYTRHSNKSQSSLEILKERYAKGEINKKEFEEMKKDLN